MNIKERRYPIYRRLIFVGMFLLTAAVQNTLLTAAGHTALLLVPLTVSVCICEKEFAGLFFGILGGALYDIASPAPDGVYALLFAALGCAVGLLTHYVFRNTLLSGLLLTLAFGFLTVLTGFIFTVLIKDATGATAIFTHLFFPRVIGCAVLLPVFYYPVRFLDNKLR